MSNTVQILMDFNRLHRVLPAGFKQAMEAEEDASESFYPPRYNFLIALELGKSIITDGRTGLLDENIIRTIEAAHKNLGYVFSILVQAGVLPKLARQPSVWPFPKEALAIFEVDLNIDPDSLPPESKHLAHLMYFKDVCGRNPDQLNELKRLMAAIT